MLFEQCFGFIRFILCIVAVFFVLFLVFSYNCFRQYHPSDWLRRLVFLNQLTMIV